MTQETIFTLLYRPEGLRPNEEEEQTAAPSLDNGYVWDDEDGWVFIEEGSDEWMAITDYHANPDKDNKFAICFIPHSAITVDEDGKIKKIIMPGD